MTQSQYDEYGQGQYAEPEQVDTAALMAHLLEQPLYKQETKYTPFQGTDDNQVKLTPGMVLQFFAKPTRKGVICPYEQVVRFIMLCKARSLDPREGDAFLVGYDGKAGPEFNLITSIQAFLKRAEAHPAYDGMTSGVIVQNTVTEEEREVEGDIIPDDCRLIGGWAIVYRKDRSHPMHKRLDLKVFDKGYSLWATNKAGMISKCAEADALRSSFPNSLAGMYMQGEIQPSDTPRADDPRTAPSPNKNYQAAKKATEKEPQKPQGGDRQEAPKDAPPSQPSATGTTPTGETGQRPSETGPVAGQNTGAADGNVPTVTNAAPANPTPLPTEAGSGETPAAPATGRKKKSGGPKAAEDVQGTQAPAGGASSPSLQPSSPPPAETKGKPGPNEVAAIEFSERPMPDVLKFLKTLTPTMIEAVKSRMKFTGQISKGGETVMRRAAYFAKVIELESAGKPANEEAF